MIKILLACSAGMSTSLLEKSIREAAIEQNIEIEVLAVASSAAKEILNDYDVCMLGPQVSFMLNSFKQMAENTPIIVIPPHIYAMAKGVDCLTLALESLKK